MEVWNGYKVKLVEVLRAGDQLSMEEDVSYDQLLNIVEQLVRDKQVKVCMLNEQKQIILEYSRLIWPVLQYHQSHHVNL